MYLFRIHPEYVETPSYKNDVALIKLSRRVDFIHNQVLPICLPSDDFRDVPENDESVFRAFVSGWGATAYGEHPCTTDEFGPAPNTACSNNFIYDDKLYRESFDETNRTPSCTNKPSPSSQHKICKHFNKWAKNNDLELWNDKFDKSYRIVYWQKPSDRVSRGHYNTITCYNPSKRIHGWCGTCYDFGYAELKLGDEGFCYGKEGKSQAIEFVRKKLNSKKNISKMKVPSNFSLCNTDIIVRHFCCS